MGDHDFMKLLDICIYDYLIREKLHTTAEIFAEEADVSSNKVAMAPPEGLLKEWWSIFWDVYHAQLQNVAPNTTKCSTTVNTMPDLISQLSEKPAVPTFVTNTAEQNLLQFSSTTTSVSSVDQSLPILSNLQTNVNVQRQISIIRDDGQGSMTTDLNSQSSNLAKQESGLINQHKLKPAHNVSLEAAKSTKSIRNKKSR